MRSELAALADRLARHITVSYVAPALLQLRPQLTALPPGASDSPVSPDGAPGALTREEIDSIQEIILWWRRRDDENGRVAPPRFHGPRRKTSVRINEQLFGAAMDKVRETGDTARMGDNISQVLEFLLWGYLGHDESFLEEERHEGHDEPDTPAT